MSDTNGKVFVVGLGPGSLEIVTPAAQQAIERSDYVVGYHTYLRLAPSLFRGKQVVSSGMRQEVDRARKAAEIASTGKTVAVVCSGDSGIYGMAGLVYEICDGMPPVEIEVIPGVPAFVAAAALLGAPLMHDFSAISLSDLLTPWATIAHRIDLAAQADFVIAIYNPRSHGRRTQIVDARSILLRHRRPATPVGIVSKAYREGQSLVLTDLERMLDSTIDMSTVLIIGNSQTYVQDGKMITPRGYGNKYELGTNNERS
ncbi:MAG: precorrin-3B C(17)-methyltransferase [Chloroflexi bacterium]|nr:precorrin-3B C(17)-methyltransferase [Chloroflexota bacterium]